MIACGLRQPNRGNATIPYRSLTKAHLDIHLDENNYNIHLVKIKRMINRQTQHIPIVFQILNLHYSHGVLCASEKGAFKVFHPKMTPWTNFWADYILMTAICIVLLQSSQEPSFLCTPRRGTSRASGWTL